MNKILPQITLTILCLFLSLTTVFALDFNGDFNRDSTTITNKKEAIELLNQSKKLGFQENKGQMVGTDNQSVSYVLFKAEAPGLNIWVTNTGLTYQFFTIDKKLLTNADGSPKLGLDGKQEKEKKVRWNRVDMVLKNASIKKENITTSGDITQGKVDYYLGHCPDGVFNVKTYTKIKIAEVYPSIDWVVYTSENGGLKHEFVVHPGADPNDINLLYEGNGSMDIDDNQLRFGNSLGHITEGKLLCYQKENEITSSYQSISNSTPYYLGAGILPKETGLSTTALTNDSLFSYTLNINVEDYDKNQDLIIDPELVWGTMLGGAMLDGAKALTTDLNNNLFVTGYVSSANFPLLNPGAGTYYQATASSAGNIFITKFDNNGALLWSTFYGGNNSDDATSITTDNANNVWVAGYSRSLNFPVQNAGAGTFYQGTQGGGIQDAIILKFDNLGNRLLATYYGGGSLEYGASIIADVNGNIWMTGYTNSTNFPVQNAGAGTFFQGSFGGSIDAFILKFDNLGTRLLATYYGGSGSDSGYAINTGLSGDIYMTGYTKSTNFPITASPFQGTLGGQDDVFILKFDNAGNRLWGTYYGGSNSEQGLSIDIDLLGDVYVAGNTASSDFPTYDPGSGAFFQGAHGGGYRDAFILKFDNAGNRLWGTYYGGSQNEISNQNGLAIDCNKVYVAFDTESSDITTLDPNSCNIYYDGSLGDGTPTLSLDHFIAKFDENSNLSWASYIGGIKADVRSCITIDDNSNLYFTGEFIKYDNISSLPILDPGNGAYFDNSPNGLDDSFVLKFSPPVIQVTSSQVDNTVCIPCNGSATVSMTCAEAPYDYVWSNGVQLLGTTSTTNTVTGLCPGNNSVVITYGCQRDTTINFTLIDGYQVATSLIDTIICDGDNVQLFTSITTPPASLPCGYGSTCSTASSVYTVGTGTANSPTYGPAYSYINKTDSRSQFLILASELTAAGVNSGTFTTIAWDYAVVYSGSNPYENFSIKMACTNETLLSETNAWITPVTEVYTSPTFLPVLGWNTITLTTTFDWDGVSNIIIETCYDNPNSTYRGGHDRVRYTTQPVNMTTRRNSGSGSGCTLASPTQDFTGIPNLQFTVCDAPQPQPTYSWTPSTDLNDATIANPIADPTTTTQYTVITTVSGCLIYDTVDVTVDPCTPLYVSFLSFEASIEHNEVVRLDWVTLVEINTDHFEIEKSINNIDWHHVTNVQSSGTSLSALEYSTYDNNPYNGLSYYRLKTIDIDGSISYSNIEAVNFSGDAQFEHILIYPNPANNEITIVGSEEALLGMKFYTLYGQEITEMVQNIKRDVNGMHVDISRLSSGVYLITTKFESYKLIKY